MTVTVAIQGTPDGRPPTEVELRRLISERIGHVLLSEEAGAGEAWAFIVDWMAVSISTAPSTQNHSGLSGAGTTPAGCGGPASPGATPAQPNREQVGGPAPCGDAGSPGGITP